MDFKKYFFSGRKAENKIDDPEDPRLLKIHAQRLIRRDIDGLLAICECSLQDGHISQEEAEGIFIWLNNHRASLATWPANILYERLRSILADGVLDREEQKDLLGIIMNIARPRTQDNYLLPTGLPLDDPAPSIIFEKRNFCFTGVFDYGSRSECISVITGRGGSALKGITKKLHYLVVGNIGSEVWKHTSFGLKIAKAVDYRESGVPIAIISENYWAGHIT